MTDGSRKKATARHEAAFQEMVAVLKRHTDEGLADPLSNVDLLAVCSNLVGKVLAFQDQRMPKEAYFDIIQKNLELGNRQVIDKFLAEPHGGTA